MTTLVSPVTPSAPFLAANPWGGAQGPSRAFVAVGTATLHGEADVSTLSQYPGADVHLTLAPQSAVLETNGYSVRIRFVGTVTGRGYYGGPLGVQEVYAWSPEVYVVREALEAGGTVSLAGARLTLSPAL